MTPIPIGYAAWSGESNASCPISIGQFSDLGESRLSIVSGTSISVSAKSGPGNFGSSGYSCADRRRRFAHTPAFAGIGMRFISPRFFKFASLVLRLGHFKISLPLSIRRLPADCAIARNVPIRCLPTAICTDAHTGKCSFPRSILL